jgi:hypothetical protein
MSLRDLAFAACRVLGIYVALQAVYPLSSLVGNSGLTGRELETYALPVVLFAGAGIALWSRAAPIAEKIAGSASAAAPSDPGAIGVREVLVAGLWLLGIFSIVQGGTRFVSDIGSVVVASSDRFGGDTPFRDLSLWHAFASAIEAGIGAYLVVKAKTIADRFGPEPERNA